MAPLPGSAAQTPKPKKPAAPSAVTVSPFDRGFVVSWTAPPSSATVPPATEYEAIATIPGRPDTKVTCQVATTTCVLLGIVNPQGKAQNRYKVSVRALNSVNWGKRGFAPQLVTGTTQYAALAGVDLSNLNLVQRAFDGADLTGANLSGSDLYGATFYEAYLTGANLVGANLRNANLASADLAGADLTGADLTGATCPNGTTHGDPGADC